MRVSLSQCSEYQRLFMLSMGAKTVAMVDIFSLSLVEQGCFSEAILPRSVVRLIPFYAAKL